MHEGSDKLARGRSPIKPYTGSATIGDPMKRASLALIFFLALAVPDACLSWMGKAVGVVRPDEIKVMTEDGKVEDVRLYGIDSPVEPQDFGKAAHLYTSGRVLGSMVEVRPLFRDHFDRVIAWVFVDGECLNKELLRKGLAWWYKKYLPFEKELEMLEQDARTVSNRTMVRRISCTAVGVPTLAWRRSREPIEKGQPD